MTRRIAALVSAALGATLVVARCGDPQSPAETPVLSGTVVDAQGAPVEGAQVGISYRLGSVSLSAIVPDEPPVPPGATRLHPNTPNPFDRLTQLRFDLVDSPVRLSVLSRDRRTVRQLVDGALQRGVHTVLWDRLDDAGEPVPPGVYIARLETGAPGSVQVQEVRMFYSTPDSERMFDLATTDRDGRFSLALAGLPIGEVVNAFDQTGTDLGPQVVLSAIELCATGAGGQHACSEVDVGDLRRSVVVTLQLP
jgi:hypothetical protein